MTRLAHVSGLEPEDDRIASAARRADEDGRPWTERLVSGCDQLGLRTTVLHGTVARVATAVGPDHPVVACAADGSWLMVVDRRGRALAVETADSDGTTWLRHGDLAERLDPDALGAVDWVAVDPPILWSAAGPAGASGGGASPPTPFDRLRWLLRQERNDVSVVLVYSVGIGVLTLATPIAVQALVNTVAFGALLQPLIVLALLLLAGLFFAAVLKALETWVVELLQRRLFVRVVGDLSHRLPRVRLSAFDRAYGPELENRFFDLFTIQKAAALLLLGGLEIVLTALVGMIVLAFYHPLLLAFDVVLVLAVFVIVFVMGRGAAGTAVRESKTKYAMEGWLEEVARLPGAFKLGGGPRLARVRSDHLAGNYLTARSQHFRIVYRQLLAALTLQAFASAGVLGIGGWLVIERQLTLGQLVAAEIIVTAIVASFARVAKYLETSYDLLAALDKLGVLVDLPLEAPSETATAPEPSPQGARLTATELSFAYEGGEPVLSELELSLAPGDRVALCGASGAGRSTLIDLLAGARRPPSGRIELEGVDLRDLSRETLRERVAAVRGAEVIDGTIADNVTFGRPDVRPADVREALRAVDLLDAVARLPDGLRTRLTPTGAPLSGGQAVRLTLARAVAGRPSLLLVDGALDGLDARTRERFFADDVPWTLLAVTDDPTVAARCARTLSLVDGALEEEA